jgi:type II secretory pathway pseudopilin PulG
MKQLHTPFSRSARPRAFTIIEIAICLGIIGFALVAIIAVLPRGMDVQKRNREETIIGQDAEVWMNLLRNGSMGDDDLTNYVISITNIWTKYNAKLDVIVSGQDYYTLNDSRVSSIGGRSQGDFPLTNGAHIVGLLSMPKRVPNITIPPYPPVFQSNYVIAYVRAFSGPLVDKTPQTNKTLITDAFTYRMIVENFPYTPVDTNAFCLDCPEAVGLSAAQLAERTNMSRAVFMMQTNSHDLRLRFRWPVLPNGQIPNYGLATFRSMASGLLLQTNDQNSPAQPIYFIQPSTFTQVSKGL